MNNKFHANDYFFTWTTICTLNAGSTEKRKVLIAPWPLFAKLKLEENTENVRKSINYRYSVIILFNGDKLGFRLSCAFVNISFGSGSPDL
jgi:hypothetical protein